MTKIYTHLLTGLLTAILVVPIVAWMIQPKPPIVPDYEPFVAALDKIDRSPIHLHVNEQRPSLLETYIREAREKRLGTTNRTQATESGPQTHRTGDATRGASAGH